MKVVMPRRKKSQWNPGGFRRGNVEPWAIKDWKSREHTYWYNRTEFSDEHRHLPRRYGQTETI